MSTATETSLRITANDLMERWDAGEPMLLLDVRADKVWDESDQKITGAVRVDPNEPEIDSSWSKDVLAAIY